jgi:flagellar basal-body rod modification protein FlgD
MQVNGVSNSTGDSSTAAISGDTGDMFMTLLVTQLKSQDPLSPMDPTQFVGQLVQFNTLSQIIQIREAVDAVTKTAG